ncbi:TMEM43 family protein [Rhizobium sp. SG2393]|uniref:TMEM43 family protein n=1 Tax=Rhizobium sp. SG2393 TaxID=3276279 RepID=UPI003672055C
MSFTETTHTSWFTRLKNGVIGIVVGLIIAVGMIVLLAWNEGRSVKTYRSLVEGAGLVVSVASDTVDPANEGKLIHISGKVVPDGTPEDSVFAVSAEGAAGLRRDVEMYQWVEESRSETKKTLGGGEETVTTYSYKKDWQSRPVDSSNFREGDGHSNPPMPFESERFTISSAHVGAFVVDGETIANLGTTKQIAVSPDLVRKIEETIAVGMPVSSDGKTLFVSNNRNAPAIGDLRIRFDRIDTGEASLIAAQSGNGLKPFNTSNGRSLFLSQAGIVGAAEMFDAAQSENTLITWLIRLGGLIGLYIGFSLSFSILGVIADVIPFVGSIVRFGTGLIAFALTLIIGPTVIALAWFAYRPLLSLGLIAGGIVLAIAVLKLRGSKSAAATPKAA